MSIDVEGLRSTIRNIKQEIEKRQIVGLEEDVARLQQIADEAEVQSEGDPFPFANGVNLPREIFVPHPDAVAEYLRAHPDIVGIVHDLAAGLLEEFKHERLAIMLNAESDDYIDETDLVFNVRVGTYDDSFIDRLHRVESRFDDRLSRASGNVYVTTDHVSAE